MFVLIIWMTLESISGSVTTNSLAMTTVASYSTNEACRAAGDLWLANVPKYNDTKKPFAAGLWCLPSEKKPAS